MFAYSNQSISKQRKGPKFIILMKKHGTGDLRLSINCWWVSACFYSSSSSFTQIIEMDVWDQEDLIYLA